MIEFWLWMKRDGVRVQGLIDWMCSVFCFVWLALQAAAEPGAVAMSAQRSVFNRPAAHQWVWVGSLIASTSSTLWSAYQFITPTRRPTSSTRHLSSATSSRASRLCRPGFALCSAPRPLVSLESCRYLSSRLIAISTPEVCIN